MSEKIVRLTNQKDETPSLMLQGTKMVVVGTLNHMDKLTLDKASMCVLMSWLHKEINRSI